jgi:molecular chaperone GrpE
MADESRARDTATSTPAGEVEIELDEQGDLDQAMRDAVAAVERAEGGASAGLAGGSISGPAGDDDVGALRREIADLRDRSMRTLADFDNFRKRSERERQETRKYALLDPLREILPIADNLERALSAGGSADDLKRGVEMILRQLQELLRRLGVREVGSDGAFDPAVHEAVAREERPDVQTPQVSDTLTRGYFLHDRLLRPAMVKVAVPQERPAAPGAAQPAAPVGSAPAAREGSPDGDGG